MAWRIELTETATRQLRKLDTSEAKRITTLLRDRLGRIEDPRGAGKALTGPLGSYWRHRVDDYWISYDIQDKVRMILVIAIRNRKDLCK